MMLSVLPPNFVACSFNAVLSCLAVLTPAVLLPLPKSAEVTSMCARSQSVNIYCQCFSWICQLVFKVFAMLLFSCTKVIFLLCLCMCLYDMCICVCLDLYVYIYV